MIEIPIWGIILAVYCSVAAFVGTIVYIFGSVFEDGFGLAKPLSIMAALLWPLMIVGYLWNRLRGDK